MTNPAMRAVVLVSRPKGAVAWRTRNDRFFNNHNSNTGLENLDRQMEAAQKELNQWQAVEPNSEFKIIVTEYHNLRTQSYL